MGGGGGELSTYKEVFILTKSASYDQNATVC